RKQAEKSLSRLSAKMDRHQLRLKLLTLGVESSTNFIVVLDKELRYWWVNAAHTRNSGYSSEELIGSDARTLVSPRNEPEKIRELMDALQNNRSWSGLVIVCRRDGSEYIENVNFAPILDEEGNAAYYLAVGYDETENERVREALLEAQKVKAKAEKLYSIGTMASGISHEINQPLNSIKVISGGLLYLLRQGRTLPDDEYLARLDEIHHQADRIEEIIKYLRSFIQNEQRRMVPCQVNSAMEAALKLVSAQLAENGIQVDKEFDVDLPPVLAHPLGMEMICVNLLTNAIEALRQTEKPAKRIRIRTRFEKQVILEIGNNGPAIEPEIQESMFELFTSLAQSGEHQGLGLAIARNTLNLYTGTIELIQSNAEGVLFKISLPAQAGGEWVKNDEYSSSG
ncbi:MAG TPA: ATP-binding protein, partial [Negativicutes bacterium]|nr:ATP-binding protein [Negativicutes bacterium]